MPRADADQIRRRRANVARELRRRKVLRFAEHLQPDYETTWYHRELADRLDAVRRGECLRLLVFMPPQHGKSELISRKWPAHLLGNDPDTRIIATSYNDDLAAFNARHVRRNMESREYAETFTRKRVVDKTVRTRTADRTTFFEVPGHTGYYLSAGIMGSMTGFGFDIGIIDDPIKNAQEADSPAYRERLKAQFHAVFETRGRGLARDGVPDRIVGVFTRWHHDDLGGYLMRLAESTGDAWDVLSLPAILDTDPQPYDPRKHGESLWPERYPPSVLERRKRNMPARTWEGLYQQRPNPEGGGIFRRAWWRHYDRADVAAWVEAGDYDEIFQTWDLAFKSTGTSRVCGIVMMVRQADLFLLDLVVDHMSYVESKDSVRAVSGRWPQAYTKVVEDRANGPALINDLGSEIGGITPWPPKGEKLDSKEARWNAATPPCRSGNVYLPPPSVPWVDPFIEELAATPHGALDDQADAFAQGVLYWRGDGHVLDDLARW